MSLFKPLNEDVLEEGKRVSYKKYMRNGAAAYGALGALSGDKYRRWQGLRVHLPLRRMLLLCPREGHTDRHRLLLLAHAGSRRHPHQQVIRPQAAKSPFNKTNRPILNF